MSLFTQGQTILVCSGPMTEFVKVKEIRIKGAIVTYWVESKTHGEYSISGVPTLNVPFKINLSHAEAKLISLNALLSGSVVVIILLLMLQQLASAIT